VVARLETFGKLNDGDASGNGSGIINGVMDGVDGGNVIEEAGNLDPTDGLCGIFGALMVFTNALTASINRSIVALSYLCARRVSTSVSNALTCSRKCSDCCKREELIMFNKK